MGDRLAFYTLLVTTLMSNERLIAVRGFRLSSMNDEEQRERAYYRAIEDFFAELRGSPHTLSTKDFQLMRSWWRDGVPMSAVTIGVTEVVNRRRERGQETPVVSLTYCRHAVRRHAKRLAEMSLGQTAEVEEAAQAAEVRSAVASLGERLKAAASAQAEQRPRVAAALGVLVAHLLRAAELPVAAVEEHLYSLEIAMLEGCRRALDQDEQELVDERARVSASTENGEGSVFRAMQDHEVRRLLDLPRLEIG